LLIRKIMKKIKLFALVFVLGSALLIIGAGLINQTNPEVKLTVLNSLERIGQDQPLFGSTQAVIKAAKNEVESFQVVIGAVQKNVRVTNVVMSDLTGKGGTIGKENISLFREEYTRVRRSSGRAQLPPGLYTDPLVPFIDPVTGKPIEPISQVTKKWGERPVVSGYEMFAVPFNVWKGQNQPVWVDVTIPKNAAAGDYTGTITVSVDTYRSAWGPADDPVLTKTISVPVTLTVWDFTLPDGPTLRNHFGNVRNIAKVFGVEPKSEKFQEIERRYCQMLSDNRINPPLPEGLMPEVQEDGSLKITPERTQALKKYIEDLHVADFEIPRAPIKDMTTTNRDKAIRYYKDFYRYVKENGWDKRAYVYMWDEPNLSENYEMVLAVGAIVHEAAPQLRRLVVEQPYKQDPSWPDMDPAIDIWCPIFSYIERESINSKLAEGDEVWSYTALAQRVDRYNPKYDEVKNYDPPYWFIDGPLTSYRTPTWMNWQYKATGLLYWSVVAANSTLSGVKDPWFLPGYSNGGGQINGEGYLLYPGIPCGIEGPVPCIRLKVLRDSMEDYEYFALLEKLAGREAVTKIVTAVAPNWWATSQDPKVIIATREKIAAEIMKLKK
jgi:hypothetical protein